MTANRYLKHWQKNPSKTLWQHPIWEKFQSAIGRKTWLLQEGSSVALVIKRNMPFGLNWLEVPIGPLFDKKEDLQKLLEQIKTIGQKEKSVFVRMQPPDSRFDRFGEIKTKPALHNYHPDTTLVLELYRLKTEEEILKQMKPKGRYNIKVAQKHGVIIKESSNIDDFYNILVKTGRRDGFSIHPKDYYQKMLDSFGDNGQLLVAEHEGIMIAGGIFVYLDDCATYYYGASDHDYRKLMAPYLIQWEAIKNSLNKGCDFYDFLGIAPEGRKNHALHGVTQFKKRFGGNVVNHPKAKEMVLRPFWYWLYGMYKKLR